MPSCDLLQPSPLFRDRPVHSTPQFRLDLAKLGPHAITSRLPFKQEVPTARFSTYEHETQKVEGLRASVMPLTHACSRPKSSVGVQN
jgi:hypothetical protein